MPKNNPNTLFLISVFGGLLGVDKFYQKKYKIGLLKLFTVGGYGIWWIYDIYINYNALEDKKGATMLFSKIKLLGAIIGALFALLIIIGLVFSDNTPQQEEKGQSNIELEADEIKISEDQKKDIYYIYWQAEHIASGRTFEEFGDGGTMEERDIFFKETLEEYEQKLAEEKKIDYTVYKNNAIEIGFGEGQDKKWNRPDSDSEEVRKYVVGEKEYILETVTKDFMNKKGDFLKAYNSCIGLVSLSYSGDYKLAPLQSATPIKIDENTINVNTYIQGENAFGQSVRENITCSYKYNTTGEKYSIEGIK